jgi:SYP5 family syntaxin
LRRRISILDVVLGRVADIEMAQSASDSWLKEFEEAMRLADDILARINERSMILASGADPSRLVSATRRKLTMLGTKLDRLESLLKNPPTKSNL